jgi:hypothetical protein
MTAAEDKRVSPGEDKPSSPPPSKLPMSKPLLASDALREDLAPSAPWGYTVRFWVAALATTCAAFGALEGALLDRWNLSSGMLALGALALMGLPLGYRARAAGLIALGANVTALGLAHHGPAVVLAHAAPWSASHVVAATLVPAALLFRARYRAFPLGRRLLALSLVAALPLVGYCAAMLTSGSLPEQIGAAIALCALASSLIGFMGADAGRAVGPWLALAVVAGVMTQIAIVGWDQAIASGVSLGMEAVSLLATALACAVAALGLFQLLGARYWERAREVDLRHKPTTMRPKEPSAGESWSG